MTSQIVVFTTDFGLSDAYAGVMKGVALSINPNLRLIDLTHQILPQNVAQGSFLLGINHRFFTDDAIHVAVVDPGVGTDRRPVLLSTPCGMFVAPDNGLLSGVITGYLDSVPTGAGHVDLPPELSAVHLTNPEYWNHPVSQTFHGRDIFTPVAAHLSMGVPPEDLGEPIDSLYYLPMPQPFSQDGGVTGRVIYQDVYGNLLDVDALGDAVAVTTVGTADVVFVGEVSADTGGDRFLSGRRMHGGGHTPLPGSNKLVRLKRL